MTSGGPGGEGLGRGNVEVGPGDVVEKVGEAAQDDARHDLDDLAVVEPLYGLNRSMASTA
jgi:hypothetical protein